MFSSLGLFFLGVSSVFAGPLTSTTLTCDEVPFSDEAIARAEAHFQANKVNPSNFNARAPINVHWHVISKDDTLAQGNIPDKQISDSIDVLNNDYATAGFSFTLVDTTRTVNASWFDSTSKGQEHVDMKNALRKGGVADLNVYSVGFTKSEIGGYATYPFDYSTNPNFDGVAILFSTVPGGTRVSSNEGGTLTHEVGHWAGLYHLWQGINCEGDGDFVDDTPAELEPVFGGCPKDRDSCPDQPGVDEIGNYMQYTDDSCTNHFTPGQITRMSEQMATYRGI